MAFFELVAVDDMELHELAGGDGDADHQVRCSACSGPMVWLATVIGEADRYRCKACGRFERTTQLRAFAPDLPVGTTVLVNAFGLATLRGVHL